MFSANGRKLKNIFDGIAKLVPLTGFQQPAPDGLRPVFLCMTPRSGSTYLSSALQANGVGRFSEHFRIVGGMLEKVVAEDGSKTYEEYVLNRIARYRVGDIFGAKVDWLQFAPLYYFGAFDHLFANARFIYLTREDMMAQAISRYIATETGYFHSTHVDKEATRSTDVPLDYDTLWRHLTHLTEMQGAWEQFFAAEGIQPLRITYEEVERDPAAVLRRIGGYVDVPLSAELVLETQYKKVRNERHEKMKHDATAEARARRQAFAGTAD